MQFPEVNAALIAVIVGIAQWLKTKAQIEDAAAEWLVFVLGALLGAGWQVAAAGTPGDFAGWFTVVMAALVHAIAPSGLYKFGKLFMPS